MPASGSGLTPRWCSRKTSDAGELLRAVTAVADYSGRCGRAGMIRPQWLLIVVIAAGLVGMHHVVHVPSVGTPSAQTEAMTSATPTARPRPDLISVTPVALASPAAPRVACCDPVDMVGHLCLTVLTAVTALAVALILAARRCRPLRPWAALATVTAVATRAPPNVPRFTQLCMLRC